MMSVISPEQGKSSLTPNQARFVLRVVGKEWLYSTGEGRPGDTFVQSFYREIESPVGALAVRLAIGYNLDYEPAPPRGRIVLGSPPTVEEVRAQLQTVGVRVPDAYRTSPEEALRYFEEFGSLYLPFESAETPLLKLEWLPALPAQPRFFVNQPLMTGSDVWLNQYLPTHLRDLYTDFDLFNLFGEILPETKDLKNRNDIIDAIVKYHRPAGHFWIEFGFTQVRLRHQLGDRTQTYTSPEAIKSIALNGRLYFGGLPLHHIGLYQIAFLFKPEYLVRTYGVEPSDFLSGVMQEIYRHFLGQIKIAEERGEQKIRFSDRLVEFNRDLG